MINAADLIAKVRQRKTELVSWEWWDTKASDLVHHPDLNSHSSYSPSSSSAPLEQSMLALTKMERKRQRKLTKETKREDQRKKIELGMERAPPPKLSRKNVAAVYGPAYLKDPTKYEQMAIEAEESRLRKHLQDNEERRSSSEQKWEKQRADCEAHKAHELHCAAFHRMSSLGSKEQFIIDSLAKKYICTGACLLGERDAFLIVETGGPELIKIMKLLTTKLGMSIVWQGKLRQQNFKRWSIHSTPDRYGFLQVYGVESIYAQLPVYRAQHELV